jgi:hypothetical protein
MEAVSKIDTFKQQEQIVCYNEIEMTREIYPLTSDYDFFMEEFSDTEDLLTVNIENPIKRIVKFYAIQESIPSSFTELNYQDMNENQKEILDQFINLIINQ